MINASETFDRLDRRLIAELQRDCGQSIEALGDKIGLSRNACWRRIRRLEEDGVITARVALADPEALGLALTAFIAVRAGRHSDDWLKKFHAAVRDLPEITGVYRTTGEVDYLIRAELADMKSYDALYQRLIAKIDLADVSASFVMEKIKETTALPVE